MALIVIELQFYVDSRPWLAPGYAERLSYAPPLARCPQSYAAARPRPLGLHRWLQGVNHHL